MKWGLELEKLIMLAYFSMPSIGAFIVYKILTWAAALFSNDDFVDSLVEKTFSA